MSGVRIARHMPHGSRRTALKAGVVAACFALVVMGAATLARAAAPLNGGMGVATTGWVTTLFLEPISYENSGYYYDQYNQLQYASYIFHHGIDVSGGCVAGSYPVYASAPGVVALAQYLNDGYGTQVVVDHGYNIGGNGRYTYTFYSHMGNRQTGQMYIAVTPGQYVTAGQLLGYQGNDGSSFGSCNPNPGTHLDWEIRLSSSPLTYGPYMRYSATAASQDFYVDQQLTYGDPFPVNYVTAGPFGGGGPPPTWTPGACGMRFSDLPDSHWAYSYVSYLYCRNVVSGYSDGTFRPDEYTTRGQYVKMIVLGHNWTLYNPYWATFSDVAPGSTYYEYVETAVLRGIIGGYNDGTFRPGNPVTRAQSAKMLVLAHGWSPTYPPTPTFWDVQPSHWGYGYVEAAVARNIIGGYTDGSFRPNTILTRAQLCKMLALTIQQGIRGSR